VYRRLASNATINILNFCANIAVTLALTPFLIHTLGDAAYGVWVLVASLTVLRGFLGVFNLGVQGALIKYVAEYHALGDQRRIDEIASAALIFYTGVGLGLAAIIAAVAAFGFGLVMAVFRIPADQAGAARLLLYYLAGQTLFDFPAMAVMGVLEGIHRYDVTRGMNIARLIVFSGVSVGLLLSGAGVYGLAAATFAGELVRFAGHAVSVRRLMPTLRVGRRASREVLLRLASLSSKLMVYGLTDTLYNHMDRVIISVMLTTTLLTDYDISFRLHTLVFGLTTIIGPFFVPAASSVHAAGDRAELRLLFCRGTRYTAALTAPVAVIVLVLAGPLTAAWMGADYAHTAAATRLFISYVLFWLLLRVGQNMITGINRVEKLLPIFLMSTLANLVISVIAAPQLGVRGVIAGTVVGNALAFFPYVRVFQSELGVGLGDLLKEAVLRVYPQALAGGGVSGLMFHWLGSSSLAAVAASGLVGWVCFGVLFLLTGMPRQERDALIAQARQLLAGSRA
jgi:O-antigen/teichoic acid export membrane protein